ncbi:putative ABC transporter ATP-binding protein [Candidatus Xenohaliotis californiensis]|uniref:ABC transporter ATP-binding protein n=1 Tax=Candidatus Xenohaliotis californiensis TaxID=84677 RepID=A0ABM9N999_9RICK|nr:putative ABC transporter ATP-binding protein [Candidatus Xenohaliotis californiensis]
MINDKNLHSNSPPPLNALAFLLYFIRPYRLYFALMFICFLASVVDRTVVPYLFKIIIDKIELCTTDKNDVFFSVVWNIGFVVFLSFMLEISYRIKGFIEAKIMPAFQADMRMKSTVWLQRYPMSYFINNSTGSIASRINDMPRSCDEILSTMIEVVVPVFCTALVSLFMFGSISYYLALFFLGWFVLHISVTLFFTKQCMNHAGMHAYDVSKLQGVITDSMHNIFNVKMFARNSYESSYIAKYQKKEYASHNKVINHTEKTKMVLGVLTSFEYGGMLIISLFGWKKGFMSIGDVVFVFNIATNMIMLAWWLVLEMPFFFRNFGILQQALSVFKTSASDHLDKEGGKNLIVTNGAISFTDVNFGYLKGRNVFDNLNVVIEPKTTIGLVGSSGSGKSTFINLLQRFYCLNAGKIKIDDQDIASVSIGSLSSNIAVVPQNVTLFNRSIAENIMCANPNATYDDMLMATKKACCHDFIMNTEYGYNSLISDVATNLSGGQKQLIGIARAIIHNAPILILDEATSALDYVTEMKIRNIISDLMIDKTVIVVAHRLSTVTKLDRILVFNNGKIVEDGTHSGLLSYNSHYSLLWHTHNNGFIL